MCFINKITPQSLSCCKRVCVTERVKLSMHDSRCYISVEILTLETNRHLRQRKKIRYYIQMKRVKDKRSVKEERSKWVDCFVLIRD